jgi:hypothetical protein
MIRVLDLVLNPRHLARLQESALSSCSFQLILGLTYMPTMSPMNTVFKQAMIAVILFLYVGHSRAMG